MKACVIRNGFGLENVAVEDVPDPSPGPGQVVMRVRAVSLNYRDLLLAKGQYNPRLKMPRVLGSDAAGEVVAVGEGVTRAQVGDHVVGCFLPRWIDGPITEAKAKPTFGNEIDGVFSEFAVFEEAGVVLRPAGLTFEEAATLPCAAVTAWNALAGCGPGSTVLLQGTGGVSLFALQFARVLGARPFITSGSDAKLSHAVRQWAEAGVNYRTNPDWDRWVREQIPGGVDRVIEVGGAGTLDRSVKAVRVGGEIALIGVLAGAGSFNPTPVLMKGVTVRGIFVGSREMFEAMNAVIEKHQIRPVIDRVFPLTEFVEALRHLESGSHFGKVVVKLA